jgi:hypothetical protein
MRSCGEHIQLSHVFRFGSDIKAYEGNIAFKQSGEDLSGK